jgi:hypothetical protein
MHPVVPPGGDALDAAGTGGRDVLDLVEMPAVVAHVTLLAV